MPSRPVSPNRSDAAPFGTTPTGSPPGAANDVSVSAPSQITRNSPLALLDTTAHAGGSASGPPTAQPPTITAAVWSRIPAPRTAASNAVPICRSPNDSRPRPDRTDESPRPTTNASPTAASAR